MFLGPAIWIDGFAKFEYISVSTIDLLGPGQHWQKSTSLKLSSGENRKWKLPNKSNWMKLDKMKKLDQIEWNGER